MGFRKRQLSRLYGFAQYLHDLLRGRHGSSASAS